MGRIKVTHPFVVTCPFELKVFITLVFGIAYGTLRVGRTTAQVPYHRGPRTEAEATILALKFITYTPRFLMKKGAKGAQKSAITFSPVHRYRSSRTPNPQSPSASRNSGDEN